MMGQFLEDQKEYIRIHFVNYPQEAIDYICDHMIELIEQCKFETDVQSLTITPFSKWLSGVWLKKRLTFNVHQ